MVGVPVKQSAECTSVPHGAPPSGGLSVTTSVVSIGSVECDRTTQDDRAEELTAAMAALPLNDPRRRRLRDQVIEAWLPMSDRLAHRYVRRGVSLEDISQTATVGLIKAVDGFDPSRGVPFPAYAIPTILGEIKRYFRDRTWAVRVPRKVQELRTSIAEAQAVLAQTSGRPATTADIAAYLAISEEAVVEGLVGNNAYSAVSLSSPVGGDGTMELGATLGADDHCFELVELRMALGPAMAWLTERERQIIAMRFYGNKTQNDIAASVGCSQMHVSRLITGALAKLRAQLADAY
jgi:RNA polymerase sigma-B factor